MHSIHALLSEIIIFDAPLTSNLPLHMNLFLSVSDLFTGKDWRLHPDWVYCEYNYAGTPGREFNTPEENMAHFFVKMLLVACP